MLIGVMLLWFILTFLSVLFVAIDIRNTPESKVLKWGFILLTAYTGPVGAFLYVLGCREPLKGLHERYIAARWRQVLGSTMHCVAGDGVGIIVGAVIGSFLSLTMFKDIALEYILGFGFGWTIFQALFMKNSMGGSYIGALTGTFMSEFLSMNILMAGMISLVSILRSVVSGADNPLHPEFWFVISMGLLLGFIAAYPMNWWLVSNHLKHGMLTIRPKGDKSDGDMPDHPNHEGGHSDGMKAETSHENKPGVSAFELLKMTVMSLVVLGFGLLIAYLFGNG